MAATDQESMRRRFSASVLVSFLFASCLEMEQTVALGPDGSGRQSVKLALRETTLAEVQKASAAAQLGATPNPTAVFDKELVLR